MMMMMMMMGVMVVAEAAVMMILLMGGGGHHQSKLVDLLKGQKKGYLVSAMGLLFIFMLIRVYRIEVKPGGLSPQDYHLLKAHLCHLALSGCLLLLAFIINGLHNLVGENSSLKISLQAVKIQVTSMKSGHTEMKACMERQQAAWMEETQSTKEVISALRAKLEGLKVEVKAKEQAVKTAEASVVALQKQSEGIFLEYDRLLEENQNLRTMLASYDHVLYRSDSKKKL